MAKIILNAEPRTIVGKKVKQLRKEGKLPAVVYGNNIDPQPITLDLRDASKILAGVTSSSLVSVMIEGKEYPSLVREKQIDFIQRTLKHVDFLSVSLTEKIRAAVTIVFEGEAPALKDFDSILTSGLNQLEIEAYPQDLPENLIVDISNLNQVGDLILVQDVKVPENVEVLSNPEEMVAIISSSYVAEEEVEGEELEELEETSDEPEVIEKGKKEEEEDY